MRGAQLGGHVEIQTIGRAHRAGDDVRGDAGIDRRGHQPGMPEQHLNDADIGPAAYTIMRMDVGLHPALRPDQPSINADLSGSVASLALGGHRVTRVVRAEIGMTLRHLEYQSAMLIAMIRERGKDIDTRLFGNSSRLGSPLE